MIDQVPIIHYLAVNEEEAQHENNKSHSIYIHNYLSEIINCK